MNANYMTPYHMTSSYMTPDHATSSHMTLRELKSRIDVTLGIPKPTPRQISEEGEMVDVYVTDDYRITVYKNGFAMAQSGKRRTVIRVDEFEDRTYDVDNSWLGDWEDATPHCLEADFFLDLPWPIWLNLKADDQLEENQDSREEKWLSRHPDIPDEKDWMLGGYSSFEDGLCYRMDMEELKKSMTERQRMIFVLYYEYGYTQQEIGEMLGIARTTVKSHLELVLKKLRNYFNYYK